jgi:hypothetical protein
LIFVPLIPRVDAGRLQRADCRDADALADGNISVLFMCSRRHMLSLSRAKVEAMLLGKVIPDPKQTAKITEMLRQIADAHAARTRAPHLQRGRIGDHHRRAPSWC